jgi:uncharacterized protein YbjT (DUF2867 family)
MENFSTGFLASEIANEGIRPVAGEAWTSFISVVDIARVAAACFKEKRSGAQYNLTGPEALSYGEAARTISSVSERTVTCHPISETEMIQGAREQGMPESAIQYIAQLFVL